MLWSLFVEEEGDAITWYSSVVSLIQFCYLIVLPNCNDACVLYCFWVLQVGKEKQVIKA